MHFSILTVICWFCIVGYSFSQINIWKQSLGKRLFFGYLILHYRRPIVRPSRQQSLKKEELFSKSNCFSFLSRPWSFLKIVKNLVNPKQIKVPRYVWSRNFLKNFTVRFARDSSDNFKAAFWWDLEHFLKRSVPLPSQPVAFNGWRKRSNKMRASASVAVPQRKEIGSSKHRKR